MTTPYPIRPPERRRLSLLGVALLVFVLLCWVAAVVGAWLEWGWGGALLVGGGSGMVAGLRADLL